MIFSTSYFISIHTIAAEFKVILLKLFKPSSVINNVRFQNFAFFNGGGGVNFKLLRWFVMRYKVFSQILLVDEVEFKY